MALVAAADADLQQGRESARVLPDRQPGVPSIRLCRPIFRLSVLVDVAHRKELGPRARRCLPVWIVALLHACGVETLELCALPRTWRAEPARKRLTAQQRPAGRVVLSKRAEINAVVLVHMVKKGAHGPQLHRFCVGTENSPERLTRVYARARCFRQRSPFEQRDRAERLNLGRFTFAPFAKLGCCTYVGDPADEDSFILRRRHRGTI